MKLREGEFLCFFLSPSLTYPLLSLPSSPFSSPGRKRASTLLEHCSSHLLPATWESDVSGRKKENQVLGLKGIFLILHTLVRVLLCAVLFSTDKRFEILRFQCHSHLFQRSSNSVSHVCHSPSCEANSWGLVRGFSLEMQEHRSKCPSAFQCLCGSLTAGLLMCDDHRGYWFRPQVSIGL